MPGRLKDKEKDADHSLLYLSASVIIIKLPYLIIYLGDCGSTMVKALCYKSEGRWFDSRWCH